jgi:hypothetical protein
VVLKRRECVKWHAHDECGLVRVRPLQLNSKTGKYTVQSMSTLIAPIGLGFATLMQPVNIGVLFAAIMVGSLIAYVATDVQVAAPLAIVSIVAPLAQNLEPIAGVLILIGLLCGVSATQFKPLVPHDQTSHWNHWWRRGLLMICLVATIIAAPWLAEHYRAFTPLDRLLVLAAAFVLSCVAASSSAHFQSRRPLSLGLPVLGVLLAGLDLMVLTGPRDITTVAIGTLALAPLAAFVLTPKQWSLEARVNPDTSGARMNSGHASVVLPWLVLGLPITAGAALMASVLGNHGLSAGPQMLTTRPKLGWGLLLAVVLASALIYVLQHGLRRISLGPAVRRERIVAILMMLVAGVVLVFKKAGLEDLAIMAMIGALVFGLAVRGFDPSWLIAGWLIGHLAAPHMSKMLASGAPLLSQVSVPAALLLGLSGVLVAVWSQWRQQS